MGQVTGTWDVEAEHWKLEDQDGSFFSPSPKLMANQCQPNMWVRLVSLVHTNIGCTAHWLGQLSIHLSRVSSNAIILEKPFQVVPLPLCLSQGCLLRMKSQRRCLWCLLRLKNQRRNQTWKCGNCRPKAAPPLLSMRKRWANQRASQTETIAWCEYYTIGSRNVKRVVAY